MFHQTAASRIVPNGRIRLSPAGMEGVGGVMLTTAGSALRARILSNDRLIDRYERKFLTLNAARAFPGVARPIVWR